MNKRLKRALIVVCFFYISSVISGCSLIRNNAEYQETKEKCFVNEEDITRFTYNMNEYVILNDTVASSDLGELVGYIHKLLVIDEQGNLLEQIDSDKKLVNEIVKISQKYTSEVYTVSYLNIYNTKDNDLDSLIIDVNGGFHRAVLVNKITKNDNLIQFSNIGNALHSQKFIISKENCTQLIKGDIVYQITDGIITSDQLGSYLDILAENILFDMNTKQPIPKEEQNKIDWTGENSKHIQRVNWVYKTIYTINRTDSETAVAVNINNEYYVAKAISCEE